MLSFFASCVSLFDMVFDAVFELAFFRFLFGFQIIAVCAAFFWLLRRGLRP